MRFLVKNEQEAGEFADVCIVYVRDETNIEICLNSSVHEIVIEGTDGKERKYGSAANAKWSGIFSCLPRAIKTPDPFGC